MATKTTKKGTKVIRGNVKFYVLNCVSSSHPEDDWTFADAIDAAIIIPLRRVPSSKDLRARWWEIDNQGQTGACVGYSTAYGVLRWHYVDGRKIKRTEKPSARFICMANNETDQITSYPTAFLETDGTQTKLALNVARKYGCVLDDVLPMSGALSMMRRATFYAIHNEGGISQA